MASVARGNSCVRAIGRRSSDAIDGGQGRYENESQCLVNRETVDWKHVSRRRNSLVRDADYASLSFSVCSSPFSASLVFHYHNPRLQTLQHDWGKFSKKRAIEG